jgi:thiol:disulfide interchange protein
MGNVFLLPVFTFAFIFASVSSFGQDQEIVTYELTKPAEVKTGEPFEINTKFVVADGWYIYAPTGVNEAQGMIETRVIFNLPQGITRAGKPKLPESQFKNGHEIYEGNSILMSQALKASKTGAFNVKARVTYQTCNDKICLPPRTDDLVISVIVK